MRDTTSRPWGVYAIVDLPYPHRVSLPEVVAGLAAGGAVAVQLRAKHADAVQRADWAQRLAPRVKAAGLAFVVNDDPELAMRAQAWGATGVHLGQADLSAVGTDSTLVALEERGLGFGLSTHSLEQVTAANELSPAYIGFGPVFTTGSKKNAEPVVGVEALRRACELSRVPVVAIGGIDVERARACGRAGAAAVAAISALVAPTPEEVRHKTAALDAAFRDGWQSRT